MVMMQSQADLPQVIAAGGSLACSSGGLHGRHQKPGEDADNGDWRVSHLIGHPTTITLATGPPPKHGDPANGKVKTLDGKWKTEATALKMTSRPSTAAPILAVLAIVLATLGAYGAL
jgi:hypothetical protein